MSRHAIFALLFSTVVVPGALIGCGATPPLYGDQPVASTVGNTPMMKTPDKPALPPYPDGPYGNQVGKTFPNWTLSGFRLSPTQTDATMLTWDDKITMKDFHDSTKYQCLVVTLGATWCGACQQEQPALTADVTGDDKFAVLGILQEGLTQGKTATRDDVDKWTASFHQSFYVVQGTKQTDTLLQGYGMGNPPTIGLPFNLIVRVKDMQIIDSVQGFNPAIHNDAMAKCAAPAN